MAASTSIATLTMMANHAFSRAMRIVRRAIRMAVAIFDGLSSMSTTSAASMAASLPRAPIAIPTSARASTGASLIPSPTKASVFFSPLVFSRDSTFSTLSAGSSSEWYSSIPSRPATLAATLSRSPVSITVRSTPSAFSLLTASAESSFI